MICGNRIVKRMIYYEKKSRCVNGVHVFVYLEGYETRKVNNTDSV